MICYTSFSDWVREELQRAEAVPAVRQPVSSGNWCWPFPQRYAGYIQQPAGVLQVWPLCKRTATWIYSQEVKSLLGKVTERIAWVFNLLSLGWLWQIACSHTMGETQEAEDKSQVAAVAVPVEANQPARRPAFSHLQLQALLAAQEVTKIHTDYLLHPRRTRTDSHASQTHFCHSCSVCWTVSKPCLPIGHIWEWFSLRFLFSWCQSQFWKHVQNQ